MEPRIRVSAILRWQGSILLCRHEKRGASRFRCSGCRSSSGDVGQIPLTRTGAATTPVEHRLAALMNGTSFAAKHVVHIIFAGDLGQRSLEAVTSQDVAVRGHRLFGADELNDVVLHPPIHRFLQRWTPGDPAVYLGALWAP